MSDLVDKGAKPKRRRELNKILLGEISAVGKPAQEDAAILLAKAAPPSGEGRPARKEAEDAVAKGAVLTTSTAGHTHLVVTEDQFGVRQNGYTGEGKMLAPAAAGGYTGYGYHDHPWYRDPGGAIVIGETLGHTHEVTEMAKGEGTTMSGTNEQSKAPDSDTIVKELQARVEKLTAEGAFSDDERTLYKSLDEAGQEAFRKAKPDERKALVEKAAADAKAAGTIYKAADGSVYNAKEHGAAAVVLAKQVDELKAQADRAEALAKEAKEDSEIRKEIAADFANLPGTDDHKVALLKSIKAIPDDAARKSALEMLKAKDDGIAEVMKTAGTAAVPAPAADSPEGKMEKMAEEFAKEHKISIYDATARLAKENAEYNALYSQANSH